MKSEDITGKEFSNLSERTIHDFGIQWSKFASVDSWAIPDELFSSITPPFAAPEDIRGKKIAEIGAGSGNMTLQLLAASPSMLVAVEPSKAMEVLKRNTREHADRIQYVNNTGEFLPRDLGLDWVFSIGVIHHIPDPEPTVRAAYEALRPGGEVLFWLYGKEGNRIYLFFVEPLRLLTKKLGHQALSLLSYFILPLIYLYMVVAKVLPVPLANYVKNVLWRMPVQGVRLVIYDQLNPHYARYYTQEEAQALLCKAGFVDIRTYQRLGYSWTVYGRKPIHIASSKGK